jgi:hypothetical protein
MNAPQTQLLIVEDDEGLPAPAALGPMTITDGVIGRQQPQADRLLRSEDPPVGAPRPRPAADPDGVTEGFATLEKSCP